MEYRKLSICVVTYNHENYIKKCILSVINQKTTFDYNIIISDDNSQDGTKKILFKLKEKYPNIIQLNINKINIGPSKNYLLCQSLANSEYISTVDGDDIIYPGKLQKQVTYMDINKKCKLTWHYAHIFNDKGEKSGAPYLNLKKVIDLKKIELSDLLKYGSIGIASTMMYRVGNSKINFKRADNFLDYYFVANLLKNEEHAEYIEEILGGYRVNDSDSSYSKNRFKYFLPNKMRKYYAKNLEEIYSCCRSHDSEIFLNALFYFLIEVKYLRISAIYFIKIIAKTFKISHIFYINQYIKNQMIIRKN